MFKNPIDRVFAQITEQLDEPQWLQLKRQTALKKFQTQGLPSRKSELWRYTDLKKLEKLQQVTDLADGNEHFVFTIEGELPQETSMQSISQVSENQWHDIETDKERVFVELNTALLNTGFELTVAKNTSLKLHIQYQQISQDWANIRTIINVEDNAQLDLTESYDYDCRINHVAIINAGDNSRLKLQANKILRETAALIHYSQINCAENVTVEQTTINNNAALAHSIEDVHFNAQHSQFKASSVNVVHGSCHISDNIQTNHHLGNCKSEIIKRSLATAKGRIAVNAKAVVAVGADGSDVAQSLKNILLSDDAKIYSRPELEINTDDVIAAHGSTVGELDELSLTYLRSRGIPKDQAQIMLIESFLQDANIFKKEDFLEKIEL